MKAILAAAALAIAASAVPAAAYDNDHRHRSGATSYNSGKTYNKYDAYKNDSYDSRRDTRTYRADRYVDRHAEREHRWGRGWWWRRHHRDNDYVEYRPHHRRHWWSY